jgi:hypothetical protein
MTVGVVMLAMVSGCVAQTPVATATVDAAKQAKVQALFDAMHMERMMNQMMAAVTQMIQQMTDSIPGADKMTPEQRKLVDDFQAKAMKLATDTMSWKVLEPEYVKLYASTYSEEEIDAITVFYKSPAGQTMLDKTPELTRGSMQIAQGRMLEMQPKMKELQEQFSRQLQATVPEGKPTSPPKNQ